MCRSLISLIFIWLLQWRAAGAETTVQTHDFTTVKTDEITENSTQGQMTMEKLPTSNPPREVSDHNITQSITADTNSIVETPQTRTMPSETFLPNSQTAATDFIPSEVNNSAVSITPKTEVQIKVTTLATVVTSHANNSTAAATVPLVVSSSTQSQNTGNTLTFQFTSAQTTHVSTSTAQSTHLISPSTDSTKSASTSPSLFTGSSTAMMQTQDPTKKKTEEKLNGDRNPGKPVAGIIGGALVLMMLGFLVIFIKKRRLQKEQITTTDWAGPSPFLEGGAENGQITRRSSNRISLSSFLPQRLSKRLSLLPETDEELQDMTPATTFGDQHQRCTFGREVDRDDVQESNGTVLSVPKIKTTGDGLETVENPVSVNSSQINNLRSTNDNADTANLSEVSANPPTVSDAVANLLVQSDDLK